MKLEVLLATMDRKDDTVLDTMCVRSDIIVCNQNSDKTDYRRYERNGWDVRWYDFQEKGVGLNRNNALLRATAEICLMADDDVVYAENYGKIILDAFARYPKADVILFNIRSVDGTLRYRENKLKRIRLRNCGRYGAVRIAFRRMSVIKKSIAFNQLFGGGCLFTAGEDTMFIRECIQKGLRVIAVPDVILKLTDDRPSTWFKGYNRKFFEDFGSSYYSYYGWMAPAVTLLQLLRRRKIWLKEQKLSEAWAMARIGMKKYKDLR